MDLGHRPQIHGSLLYEDLSRLEYGRILWRNPEIRQCLEAHWTDERHPYRERFLENRAKIAALLESPPEQDDALDLKLRQEGLSLRVLCREIPPVFGSFWKGRRRERLLPD